MDQHRLTEMKADAEHATRRRDLYKARVYGPHPTSAARLGDLQRDADRATSALNRALANA
ncbi:MAG: hypothetical protein M3M99_08005 [Actinomycetota bacterium]|nr:hypothetical protein [Actinomycetota bacterium]